MVNMRLSLIMISLLLVNITFSWQWMNPRSPSETEGVFVGTAPACAATSNTCAEDGYPYAWYAVTEGDGAYCTTGRKYYCNTYPPPYIALRWAGTAPVCGEGCSNCRSWETCLAVDASGDGNVCFSGQKALCATYIDPFRRLMNSAQDNTNGIETGFYLYFGNNFDNDLLLQDVELLNEFKSAVGKTLQELVNDLIPESDYKIESELGVISGTGYITHKDQIGTEFQYLMENAQVIPFLDVKFDAKSMDLSPVQSYLNNKDNTESINELIESKLSGTLFDDLDYEYKVYLVDSNCYY